ncbi:MAG TPA: hypothetical protein DEU93_09345 [Chitinophagaceae bacterium]|nr:hypothetical protein [Chitinophagaceae bacterium]
MVNIPVFCKSIAVTPPCIPGNCADTPVVIDEIKSFTIFTGLSGETLLVLYQLLTCILNLSPAITFKVMDGPKPPPGEGFTFATLSLGLVKVSDVG